MKRTKLILIGILTLFILTALACNLPTRAKVMETPAEISQELDTPTGGLAVYTSNGVQISLPNTYILRDIQEDLPALIQLLESFTASDPSSSIQSMMTGLEEDALLWGYDSADPNSIGTRILILKNEEMANIPLSFISTTVSLFLGKDAENLQSNNLKLGGQDVIRFTSRQEDSAQVVYALKSASKLWLVTFITSPIILDASLPDFDAGVATFQILTSP